MTENFPAAAYNSSPTSPVRERLDGHYFSTLDGWRAVAVLGVIAYHGTPSNSQFYSFFSFGFHGVHIFFAISGFLICSRLLEEQELRGRINLGKFYIRRAFRILPPALCYLSVVGILVSLGLVTNVASQEWLSCLLFYRNYLALPDGVSDYTGHFWSLSVEEHFYFFWPGLLLVMGARKSRWAAAVLGVVVMVWRSIDSRFAISTAALGGSFDWQHTDKCLDALLWGCFFALVLRRDGIRERLRRFLSVPVWFVVLLVYILTCAFTPPFATAVEALLVPLLLVGTVLRPFSVVGRFLEAAPIRWVGRLSYSLYLWQALFFVARYKNGAWAQSLPANLALLLICAVASYYVVERPMISLGKRLTGLQKNRAGIEDAQISPAVAS